MPKDASILPYTDTKPVGAADFYFAINATFRFLLNRFGIEGLRRYWTEIGGTGVYMAPASGGARSVYAAGGATEEPGYLTHDDKALYWGDRSTGAIRKIAFK